MPTHTPSPRRFLTPAQPKGQKPKPKPQSSLRHDFIAPTKTPKSTPFLHRTHAEGGAEQRVTPAKRFVIAPSTRHGRSSGEGGDEDYKGTRAAPRVKLPKLGMMESIEDSSPPESASVEVGDNDEVLRSVEPAFGFGDGAGKVEERDDEDEILFVTEEHRKRRRITPQPPSSPPWPTHDTHRQPSHQKPHFILPSTSPIAQSTPLPEAFSPSRKSQKYLPAGLASTLQSWIIEMADTGYSTRNSTSAIWSRDKEDGVKMKVRVRSVFGGRRTESKEEGVAEAWSGGMVFVKGVTDVGLYNASRASGLFHTDERGEGDSGGGFEVRVILAGQGGTRGKGGVRIGEGTVVGVRAPMWDVDVGAEEKIEKWIMGVEWVILS